MTRILLVEGDGSDADRIDATLRDRPEWDVVRAGTILDAIRLAGAGGFDAAVIDADLPDGSGIEILDFLRIGSPNIRILLLSDAAGEAVAFHALSHGAGDFVVKDRHLELELPRRIDALLDDAASLGSLIDTIGPVATYDTQREADAPDDPPVEQRAHAALNATFAGGVLAAGVWDLRGRTIAARADEDLDADGVGFALATLHSQIGTLATHGGIQPSGYRLLIDVEGGLLAVTAIPGTYVVAILLEEGHPPRATLDKLDQAARAVHTAIAREYDGRDPADA